MPFKESICIFVPKIKTMVQKINASRKHHPLQHILFWLISLVLLTALLVYLRGDFNLTQLDLRMATNILVTLLFLAVSVYINLLWLIPFFFYKRKFWQFSLLEIANIALFIFLNFYVSFLFEHGQHPAIVSEVIAEFLLVAVFLVVSTLLKVIRDSLTLQDMKLKMQAIEKEKVEAELRAIKSQVNPHFFFNTLNSLYSLSLDKSDKAPELILKLSDLMRYVIYETRDDLVAIEKQIDFLQSYIYLETLRSPEFLEISFTITGENRDLRIAPLLFIAFIENAFKHGSKERNQNPFIHILLDLAGREKIFFSVENTIDPAGKRKSQGGVGLANVKRQLDLMYPGKHTLNITENETGYKVELSIFVL